MGYVQSKKSYFAETDYADLTFDSNVSAGSLIVVAAMGYGMGASCAVTKQSGTATVGAFQNDVWNPHSLNQGWIIAVYSAYVSVGGTCTIRVNPAQTSCWVSFAIHEFSSMASSTWVDVKNDNEGSSTTPSSGEITTTNAADDLFAAMLDVNGTDITTTPDADYIEAQEYEDGTNYVRLSTIYRTVTNTLTDTANWTIGTSNQWCGAIVAYKAAEAPAGGATTVAKHRGPYLVGMMHGMRKPGMQ